VFVESMGGEVLDVEVSAKTGLNLDKLLEAILLQAEILDLKANPNRTAEGTVIEAQLDRGRGAVATVLVQRGTLRPGQIIVVPATSGAAFAPSSPTRAITSRKPVRPCRSRFSVFRHAGGRRQVRRRRNEAAPARSPNIVSARSPRQGRCPSVRPARFARTDDDAAAERRRARNSRWSSRATCRARSKPLPARSTSSAPTKCVPASCIRAPAASPNPISRWPRHPTPRSSASTFVPTQARAAQKREGIEIRYYNIIYDLVDDVKAAMSGLLSPERRETFLGNAEILEVFNITKVGKVAGCRVVEGKVERGAGVRLIRDNVVIHEGKLKTLKRFKDEVSEVRWARNAAWPSRTTKTCAPATRSSASASSISPAQSGEELTDISLTLRPRFDPENTATGNTELPDETIAFDVLGGSADHAGNTAKIETDCNVEGFDIVTATGTVEGETLDLIAAGRVETDTYKPLTLNIGK
jgi:translation initiation factor IF-2